MRKFTCACEFPKSNKNAYKNVVDVLINGRNRKGLVDTGCTNSIVREDAGYEMRRENVGIVRMANGDGLEVEGYTEIQLSIGDRIMNVRCICAKRMIPGIDIIIGMDVLITIGGVIIDENGVKFNGGHEEKETRKMRNCVAAREEEKTHVIKDEDFEAKFVGTAWKVKWKWKGTAPEIQGRISQYKMSEEILEKFNEEIKLWIKEGILKETLDEVQGVLPLMGVWQETKNKVRPVLNYKVINENVSSHTGLSRECGRTLREWRKLGDNVVVVDLRKAYLQIGVDEELWKYQVVKHEGKHYYLTRLGFGLSSAPKIMNAIVEYVLAQDPMIEKNTSFYVDDIIINLNGVKEEVVVEHLKNFGLVTKKRLECEEQRALGLVLYDDDERTKWWRRGELELGGEVKSMMTRREVFSITGKLVGHYPVVGWLRIACSYLKRICGGSGWEEDVGWEAIKLLEKILSRLREEDPVKGVWSVDENGEVEVYTDASDLAKGISLWVNGKEIEDAAWIRKKDDVTHINVAELEALIKGVEMAIEWGFKKFTCLCDSMAVVTWVRNCLSESRKPKVTGLHATIVKRRLEILHELKSVV